MWWRARPSFLLSPSTGGIQAFHSELQNWANHAVITSEFRNSFLSVYVRYVIKSTSPWYPSSFQLEKTMSTIYLATMTIASSRSKATWLPGILQDKFFTTLFFSCTVACKDSRSYCFFHHWGWYCYTHLSYGSLGTLCTFTCQFAKNQFLVLKAESRVAGDQCTFPGAAGH